MVLKEQGKIIHNQIANLGNHFDCIIVDEFIVMPDHVHIILLLKNTNKYYIDPCGNGSCDVELCGNGSCDVGSCGRDVSKKHLYVKTTSTVKIISTVKTIPIMNISPPNKKQTTTTNQKPTKYFSKISPSSGSIGNIIKLLKGFSTKEIKKLNQGKFAWQPNYYDHIIRNESELHRIQKYIKQNPIKREIDRKNKYGIYT